MNPKEFAERKKILLEKVTDRIEVSHLHHTSRSSDGVILHDLHINQMRIMQVLRFLLEEAV